ncbi:hypothetical protein J4228_04380 [Candidatus Woesearchaeota archaeon]|nr:hypothetical protein [Candidatus Woesearchaeota archaeon]
MKDRKKDLEAALKEKVSPLLEQIMEKNLGFTIPKLESDITDTLRHPSLNIYVPFDLSFREAKKTFKKEFLKRELRLHLGNVSEVATFLGLDRRSLHRAIKELHLNVEQVRHQRESREDSQQEVITRTIFSTLEKYEKILHPEKMEKMYEEVTTLSRNIAKLIPHESMTWKEAEREFEKQFLSHALEKSKGNVARAAAEIDLRTETLHRKIKKLRLK